MRQRRSLSIEDKMWIRTSYEARSHAEEEQFMNLDTGCMVNLTVYADNRHSARVLFPTKNTEVYVSDDHAINLRILMHHCVEETKVAVGIKEAA